MNGKREQSSAPQGRFATWPQGGPRASDARRCLEAALDNEQVVGGSVRERHYELRVL